MSVCTSVSYGQPSLHQPEMSAAAVPVIGECDATPKRPAIKVSTNRSTRPPWRRRRGERTDVGDEADIGSFLGRSSLTGRFHPFSTNERPERSDFPAWSSVSTTPGFGQSSKRVTRYPPVAAPLTDNR